MADEATARHEAPPASDAAPGSKHKHKHETEEADGQSHDAKRVKKDGDGKEQKTIEETMGGAKQQNGTDGVNNGKEEAGAKDTTTPRPKKEDDSQAADTPTGGTAEEPGAREDSTPSAILEKGIVYFFFRGRVAIDTPQEVDDIARSYIVLRPVAHDAKLGSGPIGDVGNSRLCALPKKVLPRSGKDRFMAFVEKAHQSFAELRDGFLSSSDYATKTLGTRHAPAATPVGEGIYAITSTGRASHLVYILTLPEELGEVQKEIGLKKKGSFIISTKNPDYPGPSFAQLPQKPDYPKELKESFRSLRWPATEPKHLDYENAQFLLVGESSGLDKATEPSKEDQKAGGKDEPLEELEKLEEEDEKRMKDLGSSDSAAIFADLQVHAKDYPKLQTTF